MTPPNGHRPLGLVALAAVLVLDTTLAAETSRSVALERYRYTAAESRRTRPTTQASLRTSYALTLTGLDDSASMVYDDAIENGSYYAKSTDAGTDALVEAITRYEAVRPGDGHSTWLVRYGKPYLVDLEYASFLGS